MFRCDTGNILTVSVFSGNYQPESRHKDQISSSLIASNHLSLSSDSCRVSNRKHFGRNAVPTCPWPRDVEAKEEREETLKISEKS